MPITLFLRPKITYMAKQQKQTGTPQDEAAFIENIMQMQAVMAALFQDYAEAMAKIEGGTPQDIKTRVLSRIPNIQQQAKNLKQPKDK